MADDNQMTAVMLATALGQARMRLDDVIAHIESGGNRPLPFKEALADNNSTCNTACSCGHVAKAETVTRSG